MKKLLAAFIVLLLYQVTVKAQTLIYHDSFNPGQTTWKDYDDVNSSGKLEGGKFLLTHKKDFYSYKGAVADIDNSRNYSVETTLTQVTGDTKYPIGLVFGANDEANLYYFGISADGNYLLAQVQQNVFKSVIAWTAAKQIRTGSNNPNKLRIEKNGDQLKLLINDEQVAQVPMVQPMGNGVGLIVNNLQTVAFDYLKVSYLSDTKVDAATTLVSTLINDMAYHTDFDKDDENAWTSPYQDTTTTSIEAGVLKISRVNKSWYSGKLNSPKTNVDFKRNYLMETEVTHYPSEQNFGYGLDFNSDAARQYHFWITASGYYYVGYTENNQFATVIAFTSSDAINKGDNVKNKLSIEHRDGEFRFYINDQLVDKHPGITFQGKQLGISACANQSVGFDYLTFGYLEKPVPVVIADETVPQIFITSPEATRGLKVVLASNTVHVAGIAKDPSGIFSVVVNDQQAVVDAEGRFTADVLMAIGDNPLMVTATNKKMKKASQTFHVMRNAIAPVAEQAVAKAASQGKYYALMIGVQDYTDQRIRSLDGPVNDAGTLSKTLTANYTFAPENVTMLKNPTRSNLFKALDDLSTKITDDDNLLIFYAGHGFFDESRKQGYWFPADAMRDKRDTWVSNADLIEYVTAIKAKHTMLIVDACFSGSIFKTRALEMASKDIQELYKYKSRKAMTSGDMKEVPDQSVFMKYLVLRLSQNTDKFISADQLFSSMRAAVINNSSVQQVPQFGQIKESGDEGGDFIFIKKQ